MTTTESASSAADTDFPSETIILKLGGSVITHKAQPETVDSEGLQTAAEAIGEADVDNLVIVHGGGSFGHPAAESAGVSLEEGTTATGAIRDIHEAMGRLNDAVLDALATEGVPAIPVRPFSAGYRDRQGAVVFPTEHLAVMLEAGFVPVLHGDIFPSRGAGATIVSGDELVVALAEGLSADAVGLCTTVPGVLDADENVIPEIRQFERVRGVVAESDTTDVTGGMAGKVRALLELDASAQIFDLAGLTTFLVGGRPGTRIVGAAE